MSTDRMIRELQRKISLDPGDVASRARLDTVLGRLEISRCACLKLPFKFFVRSRMFFPDGDDVIRSRWLDGLQQPFSRNARKRMSDWQDMKGHDYRNGPAPIACEQTLLSYASVFGLVAKDESGKEYLLDPEETVETIFSARREVKLKWKGKPPQGYCKRCGLPKNKAAVIPKS